MNTHPNPDPTLKGGRRKKVYAISFRLSDTESCRNIRNDILRFCAEKGFEAQRLETSLSGGFEIAAVGSGGIPQTLDNRFTYDPCIVSWKILSYSKYRTRRRWKL